MADPAYNRFQACGSESDLKDFVRSCCQVLPDGRLALDFERIIPIPPEAKGNGKVTRDWKIEHWSTDWVGDFQTEERTATRLILRFGSAGTPPEKIYRELARRFPEIKFVASFAEGANNFAHSFSAYRGDVVSTEREATDEDWEAATGESNEEAERAYEVASTAWKAQHPPSRQGKPITHPRFWIRHWRVRRALAGYPLTMYRTKNGSASYRKPRHARISIISCGFDRNVWRSFSPGFESIFEFDASFTPAGVHGVSRWVDQFGGGAISDEASRPHVFFEYEPSWKARTPATT